MSRGSVCVLYGSETGCASDVACAIASAAAARRFAVKLFAMDDYPVQNLPTEQFVIAVVSTTGQGDPPQNMKAFWRFLLRKSLPADSLSHLNTAVFGLGDSGYRLFNAVAKRLHRRLIALGARMMCDVGLGDDQDDAGYDTKLQVWLGDLWKAMDALAPLPSNMTVLEQGSVPPPQFEVVPASHSVQKKFENQQQQQQDKAPQAFDKNHPYFARITCNTPLTSNAAERDVRHIEFSLHSDMTYEVGDVLVVQPHNSNALARHFLEICGLDPEQCVNITCIPNPFGLPPPPFHSPMPTNLLQLAQYDLDFLATPRRPFFNLLRHFCTEDMQREKLEEFASSEGQRDLHDYCHRQGRCILEVMRDFPAARPPLPYLLALLPRIKPRQFSISSSPNHHPHHASITVAIVRYTSKTTMERHGLCSSLLAQMSASETERLPVWITKGTLRPPASLDAAAIMIGPGTGIGPLRALIQHRAAQRSAVASTSSHDMMFFGCRRPDLDYLYKDELEEYLRTGHLATLSVAFSRVNEKKVYVQHKLKEYAKQIWAALQAGGSIYLCGGAVDMPREVHEALVSIAQTEGGVGGEDEAEEYLGLLERTRRYHVETWV